MKKNIDTKSSVFKTAQAVLNTEIISALEIEMTVEKAIIPIAAIPKTKLHRVPKKKPEQIGSGVLVNIKDQYFIFSSTHVFAEFEGKSFFTSSSGEYSQIEEIAGERFSSGTIENKIDMFDASVFHIQKDISQQLKNSAITLDDFDFDGYDEDKPIFMITGFRVKDSNRSGNLLKSKPTNFPTIEIDNYSSYGVNPEAQIILSYEDQIFANGVWQQSPKPKGMSGGGIIKAQGTTINLKELNIKARNRSRQLLTAITIEQHKDKGETLGYLVGTRINVFLGLINQFLPGLLDDFLAAYKNK